MARILTALMTFALVVSSSQQFRLEIPDELHPICGEDSCGEISYEHLLYQYRGLFLTETEVEDLEKKELFNQDKMLNRTGGDHQSTVSPGNVYMCCRTEKYRTINYTMVNMTGVLRSLIHMPGLSPPRYQYVPHGRCIEYGSQCAGECILESLTLTLLVYEPVHDPPIIFNTFEVPGYCSCKITSGSRENS